MDMAGMQKEKVRAQKKKRGEKKERGDHWNVSHTMCKVSKCVCKACPHHHHECKKQSGGKIKRPKKGHNTDTYYDSAVHVPSLSVQMPPKMQKWRHMFSFFCLSKWNAVRNEGMGMPEMNEMKWSEENEKRAYARARIARHRKRRYARCACGRPAQRITMYVCAVRVRAKILRKIHGISSANVRKMRIRKRVREKACAGNATPVYVVWRCGPAKWQQTTDGSDLIEEVRVWDITRQRVQNTVRAAHGTHVSPPLRVQNDTCACTKMRKNDHEKCPKSATRMRVCSMHGWWIIMSHVHKCSRQQSKMDDHWYKEVPCKILLHVLKKNELCWGQENENVLILSIFVPRMKN